MTNKRINGFFTFFRALILLLYFESIILVFGQTELKDLEKMFLPKQHNCCSRQEKKISVGQDISGETIEVDAGHCKKSCPRYFLDDSGDASRPAVQKCLDDSECHPRDARLERVSTLQGVKVVETIDTCDCFPRQFCSRESYKQVVHVGTPYQIVIDIGVCIGQCKDSNACRPMLNKTVSVPGPNGDEVYQVIEDCVCAGNCYRMDLTETVLDYSGVEIGNAEKTSDVKPLVRHFNVGRCVGSCPGNVTETCLLRDSKEPSKCLAGLYTNQHNCTPAKFKVHQFRTRRGSKREIIEVTHCACV